MAKFERNKKGTLAQLDSARIRAVAAENACEELRIDNQRLSKELAVVRQARDSTSRLLDFTRRQRDALLEVLP